MKKLALTLAGAALLAAPSLASAQTGTINATATIQTVLNFGTSQALDFGAVTPGAGASATGWIELNRNVGVVFTLPDGANTGRLAGPGGNLQPAYTCGVGTTNSAITTAFSSCVPVDATTQVATLAAPTGSTTEYVIFNGTLAGSQTNITPGTYNGTIRITAAAN